MGKHASEVTIHSLVAPYGGGLYAGTGNNAKLLTTDYFLPLGMVNAIFYGINC